MSMRRSLLSLICPFVLAACSPALRAAQTRGAGASEVELSASRML